MAIDLGCGNLRNSNLASMYGYNVISVDAAGDYGIQAHLGRDPIPAEDGCAHLILCNYLMCFMTERERRNLIKEIRRVSRNGAYAVVEMYPAKNGRPYSLDRIIRQLDWQIVRRSKDRFIARSE